MIFMKTDCDWVILQGSWFIMNSHSMWMREEKYKKNVIDKLFELEWKPGGDPSTGWVMGLGKIITIL